MTGASGISIRVSTVIDAQADRVWDDVRHIARHVEWMKDAVSIEFDDDSHNDPASGPSSADSSNGPEGDGPEGDGPEGDGPEGDGPEGDGPEGDGPEGDGPDSDGPDSDGPDSDGPEGDGPDSEGPDSEGPDSEGPDSEGPDDNSNDPRREGVGVRFSCRTKVGPIILNDRMEVTEWTDGRLIGIRHQGLVTGEGRLQINPVDDTRTEVVWEEQLVFPARMGGPIGARLARPVLRRIWTSNLTRLTARF